MPHTLTLTYAPPLRVSVRSFPGWTRVQALADAARTSFVMLWRGLFTDARQAVPHEALVAALDAPQILDAVALLDTMWTRTVEAPARRLLPVLVAGLLDDAATATLPALSALAGEPVRFVSGLQETQQAVDTYVGLQMRDITATSRAAIRAVLREGWTTGQAPSALARALEQVVGLTPRQGATLAMLRATMAAEGKTSRQITQAVEQAAVRGVQQRARVIAETETQTTVQMGKLDGLTQAIRGGALHSDTLRRFWISEEDGRECPICRAIPGLNPDGVAYDEPFQTPVGPLMTPTAHPA